MSEKKKEKVHTCGRACACSTGEGGGGCGWVAEVLTQHMLWT